MNCLEMFMDMAESVETKTIAEKSFDYYCEKTNYICKVVAQCNMITDKKTGEVLNVSSCVFSSGLYKHVSTFAEAVSEAKRMAETGDWSGLE